MQKGPVSCLLLAIALTSGCSDSTGVDGRPVGSVELDRTTDAALLVGDSLRVSASALGTDGEPLARVPMVWSSEHPNVATVSPRGVVRGITPGATTITASARGREARIAVYVHRPAASIDIAGLPQAWAVDDTLRPTVRALDAAGAPLPPVVVVAAVSSNPNVLRVSPDGAWISGTGGSATITLSAAGAEREIPVTVVAFESVEAGDFHNCATTEDRRLYCWGVGDQGQAVPARHSYVALPTPAAPAYRFMDVGAGYSYTCGILVSGQTICWGNGAWGQLTGARTSSSQRVASVPPLATVAGSGTSACGVALGGGVYCWGQALNGAPFGTTPVVLTEPVAVAGAESLVSVEIGNGGSACGLDAAGRALCWGDNSSGELGTPYDTGRTFAAPVQTDLRFKDIALGVQSTCGVTLDGRLFCWGFNSEWYPPGTRPWESFHVPKEWALPEPAVAVSGGRWNMCVIGESGSAYCFGEAYAGMLGNGKSEGVWRLAQEVAGGHRFRSIAHGEENVCAVTVRGAIYCWGSDLFGRPGSLNAQTIYLTPRKIRPTA